MSTSSDKTPITILLQRLKEGDRAAESKLMEVVYDRLRRIARREMQREHRGHTLQPSELVSQLYIRLLHGAPVDWQNRAHFFALAARNMRRILVDHAKKNSAEKHPPAHLRVSLDDAFPSVDPQSEELLVLDQALQRLASWDERQAQIVEMRVFAGLTVEEAAAAMGISERTVKSDWAMARAWLFEELSGKHATAGSANAD
jgi:RNA polymerase sigma factor (TIGR02999 family)